ncbi:hypothetical protein KY284_036247 [Solanum tuberosum]|nr:hypothetical protein KY284_036247 [Solanum tuberosum]
MQVFRSMKRVTIPFDDKTKGQIIGRDQQADQIGYHADDDALVFGLPDGVAENDSDFDHTQVSMYDSREVIEYVPIPVFCNIDLDLFQNSLWTTVTKALELFSFLKSNKPILQQNVMKYLRDFGYNSAICKTKWESSSGSVKGGNYEFIDVIRSDSSNQMITRYIIDLDFAAEFEIARPTNHYKRMLQSLQKVFVGKSEELKQILKVMSEAVRRSMRSKELHIPPWRKQGFMQNKWLGAYKRTTNILPSLNLPPVKHTDIVQCCSVGFNAAVNCY